MDRADLQLLWEYSTWANGQILAAAGRLPPAALREPLASGHGTLFGTLLHVLDTEYGWRMLVEQGAETPVLTEQEIPDLPAMAERFATEAAAMRDYLEALTDAGLAEPLRYTVEGRQRERVRWHVLFHVVNHGTHHRGEAAAALTALGSSPGELDFTVFLSSRQAGEISLRDVASADLAIFYSHQQDPEAAQMAGFPSRDWEAFNAHWTRVLADGANITKTVLAAGQVAGNIACFPQDGEHLVGYWLGREFWGRGIATSALRTFLASLSLRPLSAYVARHNLASRRVLEKCGFVLEGEDEAEFKLRLPKP